MEALAPGQAIPFAGDRVAYVTPELANAFRSGDRLVVVQDTGDLLHIPAREHAAAEAAVGRAAAAFARMGEVSDAAVTAFFDAFAGKLEDDAVWAAIAAANAADVENAKARGRSTTRLTASAAMRADMVAGLRAWRDAEPPRGRVLETVRHDGWSVEQVMAPLGVTGFVFEGRPNVFADATGVIRAGNTVVFRIGSDALGTARAIVAEALDPALAEAGLPEGSAVLVDSAAHAAGWAMFADARLALAVARGSGPAVSQLGAIARQAGTPVSLHGTGGAWMVADAAADADRFHAAVFHSLDRKVCNTLNVCCIVSERADDLVPVFLEALERAGERRQGCKLHIAEADIGRLPDRWRTARTTVIRAEGAVEEAWAEPIADADLGREWEWEETPEVSLKIVADVAEAVALFNALSPRFAAALISEDAAAHERFYATIDAPFVGDGFTRWVDGQYALNRPELGLSNWENGRLFARGGVLAGDGVFTVRARVRQTDLDLDRGGVATPPRVG
ncbi:MAG: aldehyde dehydrogenase family protein [Alphaproteobacteria bacterium]|nr:aldehyde dehydrogenase family protein [Alphaproteobacteria bacterium]MBU1517183.1 aldehyde dehydrogenase family protein [Alphaproteobacteria bacterium]MBU2093281.1 aldehyde dehydrogenase family protein [Alphaproteobacteria bacterium]MBU2150042.1 aldehyde dehydrogenase family protein [Alphaproteobacteria bacterium]MBU2307799.1 aldehyde dehydrogenase family protein [Alphaproteobacteria bacterium]